jgi:hypothetical protein
MDVRPTPPRPVDPPNCVVLLLYDMPFSLSLSLSWQCRMMRGWFSFEVGAVAVGCCLERIEGNSVRGVG